jgi:molybdenum cofactor biosynthesis protein B
VIQLPHPNLPEAGIHCGVITVSDTRTTETDRSGRLIQQLLETAGHSVGLYCILKDEADLIQTHLQTIATRTDLAAVIFNGGTGIAPRDTTYDAIAAMLDKQLPGFGELFRWLSYEEVGSRAIASRAVAGVYQGKLIFSIPGSTNAVQLAMEKLILPELVHLVSQLNAQL